MKAYDYIVVGAGSAGCVIANRLSADPSTRVALIEAGPSDRKFPANIKSSLPIGNIFLLPHAKYNWQYAFDGGAGVNHRQIVCPRGKMLGGCSSINGAVYSRGNRLDYDDWEALGNPGWSYLDVLAAFKKHEDWQGGDSQFHGHGGEMAVGKPRALNPLTHAFTDAALAAGYPFNPDFNGAAQDGFGPWDINQRDGVRMSSSRAFLRGIEKRPNLDVLTDLMVERILIEEGRAVGIAVVTDGERREIRATREVILSAGAINSPQLLMLSGIGPGAALRQFGILPQVDLPGVGENLQDHPAAIVSVSDRSRMSYAMSLSSMPRFLRSPFDYLLRRSGPLASNAAEGGGFIRTDPAIDRPDIHYTFMVGLKAAAKAIAPEHGVMAFVALLHPKSRGRLELTSADPAAKPKLLPNFLEDREDVDVLVRGVREIRRIFAQQPIARHLGDEIAPGANVSSDAEIEAYLRETLSTVYHPVGTCKMGPDSDPLAVVDPRLKVRGIEGLRVADASIMPVIVGGNTSAPAMMIGERAAEFILSGQ